MPGKARGLKKDFRNGLKILWTAGAEDTVGRAGLARELGQ